jgi:hypothetical protein
MKQKRIVLLLLVTILFVTVFGSAAASGPMELRVNVRNASGAVVNLSLTDANGVRTFYHLEPGVYPITVGEGTYYYYASLPCGNLAGVWNVNVVKTLFLSCQKDAAFASLAKNYADGCQYFGTWNIDFDIMLLGQRSSEPDFYLGPGASDYMSRPGVCLDEYFPLLYTARFWQIWTVDEFGTFDLIAENPN